MPSYLLKLSYLLEYYESDLMKVCVWLLNSHSPPPWIGCHFSDLSLNIGYQFSLASGFNTWEQHTPIQRAKKVVSDSLGLVDFSIGLVIFVLNVPDGQVLSFGEI